MQFAAVHIPEFPLAAWLRAEPSIRARALAVLDGEPPLERVVALNGAGEALGLLRGMSKVQAGLAGPVHFRARSLVEEQAAFAAVWAVVERFAPRAEAVAAPANNYAGNPRLALALLLDRKGTDGLLGAARAYAETLAEELLTVNLPAHIAVTSNAEASLLLARSCPGVTCVEGAELARRLAGLPVTALPCSETVLTTLGRWGIRTLSELAALPEDALVGRLGQGGRRLRRLALGIETSLLIPREEALTLHEQIELDTPVSLRDSLLFVIASLLERVVRQAVEHACALRSVTLRFDLVKRGSHEIAVRPASPSQNRDQLLKLLQLRLQADPPRAAVVALALTAEPALPQTAQRGLFQAQFPEGDKLDVLLARLKSIAGEECVGSPRLIDNHCDDLVRMAPFAPSAVPLKKAGTVSIALRRSRPPEPVQVGVHLGSPRFIVLEGVRLALAAVAGPWQSSGSWWDEHAWQSEEWDAVVEQPLQILRLRYERGPKTWYVAGVYD